MVDVNDFVLGYTLLVYYFNTNSSRDIIENGKIWVRDCLIIVWLVFR